MAQALLQLIGGGGEVKAYSKPQQQQPEIYYPVR